MCGRYRLTRAQRFAQIAELGFAVEPNSEELNEVRLGGTPFRARYNVAPTQQMPVVTDEAPHEFTLARWGLVPTWAKDAKIGAQCINARCETVATKPAFRSAWKKRRCLVPADGFYEWMKVGASKVPHHILMRDEEPFAFAGLWEAWRDPNGPPDAKIMRTFTIITGPPNELVAPIHDRMPVILPRENYAAWLSPDTTSEDRTAMLKPFPAEAMRAYPISPRVSSPRNDDVALLEPATAAAPEKPLPRPPIQEQGQLF